MGFRLRHLTLLVMGLSLAACQAGGPSRARTPNRLGTSSSPKAPVKGIPAATEALRPVGADAVGLRFSGKVQLLSNHGGGLLSNNSGGLISDHGAGLVANNGGGLVANNGGGLVANNGGGLVAKPGGSLVAWTTGGEGAQLGVPSSAGGYRLTQAASPSTAVATSLLADALVEFLDGQGRLVVGADGKPISALSDREGRYSVDAKLPPEALVMRVRLYGGGQLQAIVAKDGAASRTVDLSTPSSLGAAYVLERFVQGRPGVLDKLPEAEALALTADLAAAIGDRPNQAPGHEAGSLVALTESLKAREAKVASRLERIRSLLLVGQSNLGNGRLATEVAMSAPGGLNVAPDGTLFITEAGGRLRRLAPNGRISTHSGGGKGEGPSFQVPVDVLNLPDGRLLVSDSLSNAVRLVDADGNITPFAGRGEVVVEPLRPVATEASLVRPNALALGPDGMVYITEVPKNDEHLGRILKVDAQGQISEVPGPPDWTNRREVGGLTFAPDGSLWAFNAKPSGPGLVYPSSVYRRDPVTQAWQLIDGERKGYAQSRLLAGADGFVYRTHDAGHVVLRYPMAGGPAEVVVGTGQPGASGDGGPAAQAQLQEPVGMAFSPDQSTLYISDVGTSLVRAVDLKAPNRPIRTVAGLLATTSLGDASTLPISGPSGLALDSQGRLLISETSGSTIKRLVDGRLELVGGLGRGYSGDGGPATQARFDTPTGIAHHQGKTYVIDTINERLRLIDPQGQVSTVMGQGPDQLRRPAATEMPPNEVPLDRALAVTVDPQGRPVVADNALNRVYRLDGPNKAVLLAGKPNGEAGDGPDGGPAVGAALRAPTAVTYGPDGNLYIADAGNGVIRRVTGLDTPNPRIERYLGLPFLESLASLKDAESLRRLRTPAGEVVLVAPACLAFDPQGRLLVAEGGTDRLRAFLALAGIPDPGLGRVRARIRRLEKDGSFVALAGDGTGVLDDVNDEVLISPFGLLVDPMGRLIVADSGLNQVKLLAPEAFEPKP